jgi:hypothetical protein
MGEGLFWFIVSEVSVHGQLGLLPWAYDCTVHQGGNTVKETDHLFISQETEDRMEQDSNIFLKSTLLMTNFPSTRPHLFANKPSTG